MNPFHKLILGFLPWSPRFEISRARPLVLREATPEDFQTCERLHVENESFGVPSSGRNLYFEELRSGNGLTLVAEEAGQIVGTCGIHKVKEGLYWFTYGLVLPARHGTGIGTTMFLARLALLPSEEGGLRTRVGITALETSISFYKRFGFRFVGLGQGEDGGQYSVFYKDDVDRSTVEASRAVLERVGAVLPRHVIGNLLPREPSK